MKSLHGKLPSSGYGRQYAAEHERIFGARCNRCPSREACKAGCQRTAAAPEAGERGVHTLGLTSPALEASRLLRPAPGKPGAEGGSSGPASPARCYLCEQPLPKRGTHRCPTVVRR